jgi:hypothetical protein
MLPLQGKIVEIGIDATCERLSEHQHTALTKENIDNTNSCHLELYTILGEYDNAGFPLSYCLLTTATSIEDGKHTKALVAWATILCHKYSIVPRFVHTDKDMVEISASRQVWPKAKHQLCWWHQHEALRRWLKGNLPMSSYNTQWASHEHTFINIAFKPHGQMNPNDIEGYVPGEICEQGPQGKNMKMMPPTSKDPNSIKLQIPIVHHMQDNSSTQTLASSHPGAPEVAVHSTMDAMDDVANLLGASTQSSNTIKLTI